MGGVLKGVPQPLVQRLMINFLVISSCKREQGFELHHLVVSWIRWWAKVLERPGKTKHVVRGNVSMAILEVAVQSCCRKTIIKLKKEASLAPP